MSMYGYAYIVYLRVYACILPCRNLFEGLRIFIFLRLLSVGAERVGRERGVKREEESDKNVEDGGARG